MRAARIVLALLPAAALAVLAVAMAQAPLRIAPDAALNVEIGDRLLDGQRPYVDFVETNPPLIMYLSTAPALLARSTGLHPVVAFNAAAFLLVAWSTWATRGQLAALRLDALGLAPDLIAAAWAALSLHLWRGEPWPVNDFGQREHLFVLLWLPYALLRCRAPAGASGSRAAAVALGVAAGLGACIKPHFLALALAAELALALLRRPGAALRAPAPRALAAVALLYLAHFAVLPAAVRQAWFGRWLPFVARYYSVYALRRAGVPFADLALYLALGVGGLAAGWSRPLRATAAGALYTSLGAFTAAAVAIFYLQGKGFYYHQIPALAGAVVLVAAAVAQALAAALARLPAAVAPAWRVMSAAAAAAALLAWQAPAAVRHDHDRVLEAFRALAQRYAEPGEPLAILSVGAWPEYPILLQLERRQAGRFLSLVHLPLAIAARADDGGRSEERILAELAEDLRAQRPPLIAISDIGCAACDHRRLSRHLREHAATAPLLQGYERRRHPGLPARTVLLVRADRADR